jgi:hypothetical protein
MAANNPSDARATSPGSAKSGISVRVKRRPQSRHAGEAFFVTDQVGEGTLTVYKIHVNGTHALRQFRRIALNSQVLVRPEKGAENLDFSFAIRVGFPALHGVLLIEEVIQAVNAAINAATWEGACRPCSCS